MYLKFGSASRLDRTSVMENHSRGFEPGQETWKKRPCDGVVRCDVVCCVSQKFGSVSKDLKPTA